MRLPGVRAFLSEFGSGGECIHECRHCGETVESRADSCPLCGRSGIATYEVR